MTISNTPEKKNNNDTEKTGVDLILDLVYFNAEANNSFFYDQFKEYYVALGSKGSEVMNLDSQDFRQWVFNLAYQETGKGLSDTSIKTIINILKYKARATATHYSLSVRAHKQTDGLIFYDLGKDKFVLINSQGWSLVETEQQIMFKRFNHQKQQDLPVTGGNINDLLKLINLSDKKDEILLKVYLVASFIPGFPHPVLVIQGPQGSAKSTLCRFLKDLIDPSSLETTSLHSDKDIAQFIQTASHHWFLVLDNLSGLSGEISDVISRICTGGGLSKRSHYTNDDDFIYNFRHLVALNGITQVVYKPDLLDRSVIIQLERINEEARMTEEQLWENYRQIKPGILGAIFEAVSGALREYPTIKIKQLPRMADFVKMGCAIAKALGYTQEEFLEAYAANTAIQIEAAVDANPIATAIVEFMKDRIDDLYTDTPANFYKELSRIAENLSLNDSPGWPTAANALSKKIPEFQPVLQTLGLKITKSKGKLRHITIFRFQKQDDKDDSAKQPSPSHNPDIKDTGDGRDDYDGQIPF